jgi:hypothetical protein
MDAPGFELAANCVLSSTLLTHCSQAAATRTSEEKKKKKGN